MFTMGFVIILVLVFFSFLTFLRPDRAAVLLKFISLHSQRKGIYTQIFILAYVHNMLYMRFVSIAQ